HIGSQFFTDFQIPELSPLLYVGGEIVLKIDSLKQLHLVKKNLPVLAKEIGLGIESGYQAHRILEMRGLPTDEKVSKIQENILNIVKHRPQNFDYDILRDMQHFLVLSEDEFKAIRSYKHMSRIICFHYLFRKALLHSQEAFPDRRFVSVKVIQVFLE